MFSGGEPGMGGYVAAGIAGMAKPSVVLTHYEDAICKPSDVKQIETVKRFAVTLKHQEIATASSIEADVKRELSKIEGSSVGSCREVHFLRLAPSASDAIQQMKMRNKAQRSK